MDKLFIVIIFLLVSICYGDTQVTLVGPKDLAEQIKIISNLPNERNFGEIPYGKSFVGYLVLQKNTDGTNYWCDTNKLKEIPRSEISEFVPIVLVDHSTDCPYSNKAYNVRQRGGGMMMLISDDNSLMDAYNNDDHYGHTTDIPSVIVPRNIGDLFKNYLLRDKPEKIVLAIKFFGAKEGDTLQVNLFFRSDDVKALNFFKEFEYYIYKLGKYVSFNPIYKYNMYEDEETNDSIEPTSKAPCVKKQHYCTGKNKELHIENPRIILLENIRQSCIFSIVPLKDYWSYMVSFSELCADLNNPTFNEECSINALKSSGLNNEAEAIKICMKNMINTNSKIDDDYNSFAERKVFKVPELVMNGIKYRGNWYGKNIFHMICSGFIDNEEICKIIIEKEFISYYWLIFIIAIVILVIMIILLICYRRTVNKSLEISLQEKIQQQTMFSIGQYRVFKEDKETGRKTVDNI